MSQRSLLQQAFVKFPRLNAKQYMALTGITSAAAFHSLKKSIRIEDQQLVIPVHLGGSDFVYTTDPTDLEVWAFTHKLSIDGKSRTYTNIVQLDEAVPMLEVNGLAADVAESYGDLGDSLGRTDKDYGKTLRILDRR